MILVLEVSRFRGPRRNRHGHLSMMRNRIPLVFKEQFEWQKHQNIFLHRALDCSLRG